MPFAYGVDEDTAMVVEPCSNGYCMAVLGKGGVGVFDLRKAELGKDPLYWDLLNIRTSHLTTGARLFIIFELYGS